MTGTRTYLDYNATAPLRPEARAAVVAALEVVGNPSSVHAEGRAARALIEDAREKVAALVGARPSEVVFTSGATEANAWVMGLGWDVIAHAAHEHPSVIEPARSCGARRVEMRVRADGTADLATACDHSGLRRAARPLTSLHLANGETGVLQPVAEAVACRPGHGVAHTDATQAAGRIAVDMRGLGVDLMSLSAHKLGGPKGVGALVVREGVEIAPMVRGGGQERRRRAGTENVAAIAGFGAAAAAARRDLADMPRLARMRDRLEREVLRLTPATVVPGADAERLANTACIALAGARAETLVIQLDLDGIAVSAGSACSSGKVGASHVLAAMGIGPELASAAIRVSLGHATREADIDAFLSAWARHAARRGAAGGISTTMADRASGAAPAPHRASAGDR